MHFFKTLFCVAVLMPFIGCKNDDDQEITLSSDKECVVVGNIKGLKNGRIELEDEFDGYRVIAEGKIRNGKFIIRTEVSKPTHVFAYAVKGGKMEQVRYFFLEPGIISVGGDFDIDQDNGATGTLSNDYWQAFRQGSSSGRWIPGLCR